MSDTLAKSSPAKQGPSISAVSLHLFQRSIGSQAVSASVQILSCLFLKAFKLLGMFFARCDWSRINSHVLDTPIFGFAFAHSVSQSHFSGSSAVYMIPK